MSVLIKGMDFLPKSGVTLEVYKAENGETYIRESGMMGWSMKLVTLPEKHGRLVEFIDVVTTEDEDSGTEVVNFGDVFQAYFKMREAKPVIEAEGE